MQKIPPAASDVRRQTTDVHSKVASISLFTAIFNDIVNRPRFIMVLWPAHHQDRDGTLVGEMAQLSHSLLPLWYTPEGGPISEPIEKYAFSISPPGIIGPTVDFLWVLSAIRGRKLQASLTSQQKPSIICDAVGPLFTPTRQQFPIGCLQIRYYTRRLISVPYACALLLSCLIYS